MTRRLLVCSIIALVPLVGCASLPMMPAPGPDPVAVANGTQAMAVVEVRAEGKKPKMFQMALEGDMHVQDAIEKSRVKRKFRRMNVSVLRTSPEGRRQKMDCKYDGGKRRIAAEYDYALHQGDYIVISEDTTTVVDDMVAEAVRPLAVFQR